MPVSERSLLKLRAPAGQFRHSRVAPQTATQLLARCGTPNVWHVLAGTVPTMPEPFERVVDLPDLDAVADMYRWSVSTYAKLFDAALSAPWELRTFLFDEERGGVSFTTDIVDISGSVPSKHAAAAIVDMFEQQQLFIRSRAAVDGFLELVVSCQGWSCVFDLLPAAPQRSIDV